MSKLGTTTRPKLHKLCYYTQAWYLVWNEVPLFKEDFEASDYGVTYPELSKMFENLLFISKNDIRIGNIDHLTKAQKKDIDIVLDFYGNKDGHWLHELVCQERPWREAMYLANASVNGTGRPVISKELMRDYYADLV